MSIVCRECGFENEDNEKRCAMCDAELLANETSMETTKVVTPMPQPYAENETLTVAQIKTVAQVNESPKMGVTGAKKFFVSCENSRSKTYVESSNISSYYCEGCKEEHQIDGFFWIVQEEFEEPENITSSQKLVESTIEQVNNGSGQHLVLEDVDTHMKIEISSSGGTFGRYGTFGSAYLQSDPRGRMVSGEHCRFKYEYGRWSIEHLSRTNDTVYNGRKLEHGFEEAIRDGKIITFANAISFMVRIF